MKRVRCPTTILVGEAADIDNGSTGGRQLIGCATAALVRGTIAERGERNDLVEVVVDPNGMADWQVLVLAGQESEARHERPSRVG